MTIKDLVIRFVANKRKQQFELAEEPQEQKQKQQIANDEVKNNDRKHKERKTL